MSRFNSFDEYDVIGDIPRLSPEQVAIAPYESIQEAAEDLLTNEQLDESFDKIEAAVLALCKAGEWK